ncbi:uncharacterized protein [Procambarus clarkii]|uniref:uncharacterized protein n=1 Tax=Procambarus clarkii TaxID=6728 RepID=UPI001E672841|nr:uncharacterized protein LOC123764415 isoform X2 [Procambarus clarkii]
MRRHRMDPILKLKFISLLSKNVGTYRYSGWKYKNIWTIAPEKGAPSVSTGATLARPQQHYGYIKDLHSSVITSHHCFLDMLLLVISLLVAAVSAGPGYTRVFTDLDGNGNYLDFTDYEPDLLADGFDNAIDSVLQTGMWMYYENTDYNVQAGSVYWVHGIDIGVNFPNDYIDITSSLRYAGSPYVLNDDTWTVYEGTSFAGSEYYGSYDSDSLGNLAGKVSSLILTGVSPWTIYSGENFSGDSLCVYPDTDHDTGADGSVLDFGIFPNMASLGINDNSIYSVKKGCWTKKVINATKLHVDGRLNNGAWGHLDL